MKGNSRIFKNEGQRRNRVKSKKKTRKTFNDIRESHAPIEKKEVKVTGR